MVPSARVAQLTRLAMALAVLLLALPARAGVHINTETTHPGAGVAGKRVRSGDIWLDGDRLKMTFIARSKLAARVIFRGDRGLLWALDDEHRTFVQVDQEEVTGVFVDFQFRPWNPPLDLLRAFDRAHEVQLPGEDEGWTLDPAQPIKGIVLYAGKGRIDVAVQGKSPF